MDKLTAVKVGVKVLEKSFRDLTKYIKPGQTEMEVARFLKSKTIEHGAQGQAFRFIIASGSSAAEPHHKPTNKKIEKGEMVVVDFGVKISGYCTDLSRTLYIGKPTKEYEKIYGLVLKAQEKAIKTVTSGIMAKKIDEAARSYIIKTGYGRMFIHSTGHGVGKKIHEAPKLGPKNNRRLIKGQIVTIEPGVYIKEWGGVRIEDMVLVKKEENIVLTKKIPKTLKQSIINV
jgi:Xaa-Pro aminopeptidase